MPGQPKAPWVPKDPGRVFWGGGQPTRTPQEPGTVGTMVLTGVAYVCFSPYSVAAAVRHVPIPTLPRESWGSGIRLLLAGKSGAGKSATGNTLLGERVFESRPAAKLVTASCVQAWGRCDGEDVTVIDTADILHPGAATSEAYKEIARCVRLSSPGPHALLLVTPLGQFTEEDAEAAQRLQDIFGADVLRRTVVLLTHAEALAGRPLQEHLRRGGSEALQDLILQCGGRCCSFRNGAAGLEQEQQAARVMGMVCRVLREHRGTWHSSAMYLEPSLTEEKVREHMGRHRAERRRRERARAEPRRRIVACGIVLFALALLSLIFLLFPDRLYFFLRFHILQ